MEQIQQYQFKVDSSSVNAEQERIKENFLFEYLNLGKFIQEKSEEIIRERQKKQIDRLKDKCKELNQEEVETITDLSTSNYQYKIDILQKDRIGAPKQKDNEIRVKINDLIKERDTLLQKKLKEINESHEKKRTDLLQQEEKSQKENWAELVKKQVEDLTKIIQDICLNLQKENKLQHPILDEEYNQFLIINGFPQAAKDKFDKFQQLIEKSVLDVLKIQDQTILSLMNNPLQPKSYGWNETKDKTSGSVIIDFKSAQTVEPAKQKLTGHSLKGGYVLRAFTKPEFDRYLKMDTEINEVKKLSNKDLYSWLLEHESIYEYFFIQTDKQIFTYWMDHITKTVIPNEHIDNSVQGPDSQFIWSHNGTYLVEITPQGFWLRGGQKLEYINFFQHQGVLNISFSKDEKYILSYNGLTRLTKDYQSFRIWRTNKVQILKYFKAMQLDIWESIKWSPCGRYFAKIEDHQVLIYQIEGDSVQLIENSTTQKREPIKIPNIQVMEWMEGTNQIICTCYDGIFRKVDKELKTRIVIVDIKTRREKNWKSIQNSSFNDIKLIPGTNGNWCISLMSRLIPKSNNKYQTVIAIGYFKKETVEVEEIVIDFPIHHYDISREHGKIAICYKKPSEKDSTDKGRFNFAFYELEEDIKEKQLRCRKIGEINDKNTNEVQWSKSGLIFNLVNKDPKSSDKGLFEIGYLKQAAKPAQVQWPNKTISHLEKFSSEKNQTYMTHCSWDFTGKLIITGSNNTNSFVIWNAQGDQIYKDSYTTQNVLVNMNWRPRYTIKLSEEKEKELDHSMKKKREQFTKRDDDILNYDIIQKEKLKQETKKKFGEFLQQRRDQWKSIQAQRNQILGIEEKLEKQNVPAQFIIL